MPHGFQSPEKCPVCGADVPRGTRSCPECGADERTGWDEDAICYDGIDLPSEAYDESKDPPASSATSSQLLRIAAVAALVLLLILVYIF